MKRLLFLILLSLSTTAFAQNKNCDKAKTAFEAKKFKAADKYITKCIESEPKNSSALLLKSRIQYEIYKDKSISTDFPNAMKDAIKYAEKALETLPNEGAKETFKQNNSEYFSLLVKQVNKEAMDAYNTKRYSKALPLFKKNMLFSNDTMALVYAADCYWETGEKHQSIPMYKHAAEIIYAAVLDSNSKVYGYHKEPFRKLCEYYASQGKLDSAYLFVKNGRELLPNDAKLSEYTYKLMRHELDNIPPSYDYLSAVRNGLKDFPFDSFLNHRENSIYIFLLNGMAESNEQRQFDSLMLIYAKSKSDKKTLKQLALVKKYDIFAGMDKSEFLKKITLYFAEIGLPKSCYASWMCQYNIGSTAKSEQERTKDILTVMQTEPNIRIAKHVYNTFMLYNFKSVPSADFIKSLNTYTNSKNAGTVQYIDLQAMIGLNDMCVGFNPKVADYKNKVKAYRMRLIQETTDSGDFFLARKTWNECIKLYPDQSKVLNEQWRKIVENDFKLNYFGSRINNPGKNEKGVPEYNWNGFADSCMWGKMTDDIALRAEQRINYFRRMAGLTEMIALTKEDNEVCMMAALMCESNKAMSHDPNDGWRCFIPAGADALKNSLLTKDGNPAIAVTAAMGQNHATVGNRRWLLYPQSAYMGIGTSKSYTVIKAVDQSQTLDTNKYKSQYIAWPPANTCPKMLVFKKWSFSIDQNTEGAIVTMKDASGNDVELKQETNANGYGLNTVVWEPKINAATLTDNTAFTVTVKLKNNKTYTYTVNIIDVKL